MPNLDLEGNETDGTHWVMDEAELTHEEYEWYQREMDSPALDMMMQQVNDVTANQELADITAQENHEEQMQLLADIQADILLGGEE